MLMKLAASRTPGTPGIQMVMAPVASVSDLKELEQKLKNPEEFSKMVSFKKSHLSFN